jgi:hypothetical protein
MPIIKYAPPSNGLGQTPGGDLRLVQRLGMDGEATGGRPRRERAPSWGETWAARAGTSLVQSVVDAGAKLTMGVDERFDPAFQPYRYLQSRPDLLADPVVQTLIERGQFDEAGSLADFEADLINGRRFLADAATLERASTGKAVVTFAGAMIGDPTNLIPFGAAIKAGRGASLAMSAGRAAAVAGGSALAIKKTQDALTPAANDPSWMDEAFTAGASAGLGASLGLLLRPSGEGLMSPKGWIPSKKAAQLRRDLDRLVREPVVEQIDYATIRTDADLAAVSLSDEIGRGRAFLSAIVDLEEPVANRTITALYRKGDETSQLLDRVRAQYAAAGVPLREVPHPSQWFLDLTEDARAVFDHPAWNVDATPADLGYGAVDTAVSNLSTRYANLLTRATPGGRVAQSFLSQLNDVHRTLAGSAQTMSRGSATDPLGFVSGASAENIKGRLEGFKDRALISLGSAYSKVAKAAEPVKYAGVEIPRRFGRTQFVRSVLDVMRRDSAKAQGFAVADVGPVPSVVREGVDVARAYLARMREELETVGLLDTGPRSVANAEVRAARLERRIEAAKRRVVDAEALGDEGADLLTRAKASLERAERLAKQQADDLASVRAKSARADAYLPRVFDVSSILRDEQGFKAALVRSFQRVREGGVEITDPELRPLVSEVVDRLPLAELEEVARGAGRDGVAALREGDLSGPLLTAYRAELDAFHRRAADAAFERITAPNERHGVAESIPEDPIRRRVLEADDADLAPFLEQDLELILERYHRVIGGRVAVRRAIQLNPDVWGSARLRDGRPVVDGPTMMEHLRETLVTMDTFARTVDAKSPSPAGPLAPMIRSLRQRIDRDIGLPLDIIEGRDPMGESSGVFASFRYMGRLAGRAAFLNKMGSVAVAQANDFAPLAFLMMMRPRLVAMLPRALGLLKGLPRQDLEIANLMFDQVARTRALADTDYLTTRHGVGEGMVRRVTGAVERGAERLSDVQGKITGMEYLTDIARRVGGGIVLNRVGGLGRRLARAERLRLVGEPDASALSLVGLSRVDAAWTNKMGLDGRRARRFERLMWEHGLDAQDRPIRERVTWAEFQEGGGPLDVDGDMIKPNFAEWPTNTLDAKGRETRDLLDTLASNIHGEVGRNLIVKPGAFDKPLSSLPIIGRLFHQFQSFAFAFANQRLKPMAQLPARYQLGYAMSYLFMGALTDAMSNALAGRRSLEESAEMWASNPAGAVYGAWDRSGLSSWLARPLAVSDAMGIPFSPGNFLENTVGSSAARHVAPGRALTWLGPAAGDADRVAQVLSDLGTGRVDERTAVTAWKLAPFQNLVWLRLLHQTTGAPVVPEAITGRAGQPTLGNR